MANASTSIQRLSVEFNQTTTDVYVYILSSEPDNPFWGNGCQYKSFPASQSLQDILPEIANYIEWKRVCPSCHGEKYPEDKGGQTLCHDVFHLDPMKDILSVFNEDIVGNDQGPVKSTETSSDSYEPPPTT